MALFSNGYYYCITLSVKLRTFIPLESCSLCVDNCDSEHIKQYFRDRNLKKKKKINDNHHLYHRNIINFLRLIMVSHIDKFSSYLMMLKFSIVKSKSNELNKEDQLTTFEVFSKIPWLYTTHKRFSCAKISL